ncbi:hypothetical protein B296_00044791 [Ensete ventricosum]|uniref:Uncharacterized protein n=1 Tax=Ensete ventricosum TaxID=4639 RepID=A0A426Y0N2_ENSVE|nr:hypothetical protein B296_00044791 [Ensete ventricosum]
MEKCLFPIVTFYFVENLFASRFAFLQIMRLENEFSAYKVRAHALLHKKDAELAEAKNSELLKSLEQAVKEADAEIATTLAERDKAVKALEVALEEHDKDIASR